MNKLRWTVIWTWSTHSRQHFSIEKSSKVAFCRSRHAASEEKWSTQKMFLISRECSRSFCELITFVVPQTSAHASSITVQTWTQFPNSNKSSSSDRHRSSSVPNRVEFASCSKKIKFEIDETFSILNSLENLHGIAKVAQRQRRLIQ